MIEIRQLTKAYGGRRVVDGVDLVVSPGSITAIVGESGSGKSTLLKMINRLVEPTSGSVLIDGRATTAEPAYRLRRRIGYVIQGHGLFPHKTVADNVATVPQLLGWSRPKIRDRVHELLELFGLDPAAHAARYPHELSGGQQQRVGVARALAGEPSVLLMDEPFGALDPLLRGRAQDELRAIQRRFGTTVLMVTHDMDEAFRLADRIAVMQAGVVLQHDVPERLLASPAHEYVTRLTGTADRALKLLSLQTVDALVQPGAVSAPWVSSGTTLRDTLSILLWARAEAAGVVDADGRALGVITLEQLRERAGPAP
jgi:osmoprotectant transport system ATP-binding protein